MNAQASSRASLLASLLSLAAVGLIAILYFSTIWWVSLTAPNYPREAFPDGVRIHFHMNGVFNGCAKVEKTEIREEEALDCVHEMDTINHYVGMYPIAAGGVLEKTFSPFLMAMLAVMLIGFAIPRPKARMAAMGLGFAAIFAWMLLVWYAPEGLRWQGTGFVRALVTSIDQEAGKGEGDEGKPGASAAQALIAELKASLARSADRSAPAPTAAASAGTAAGASEKAALLDSLRTTYERDQEHRPADAREPWTGSGAQVMAWHYGKSLGRYFNNPEEIRPRVAAMARAGNAVPWLMAGAMLLLLWGARRSSGPLYWLLVLVPMALPVFFILDYSAWLWWYGHNLNAMGAFTVKPFMPTVLGDGKVAQFSTHSYPAWGFGVMLLSSLLLALAALLRRKGLNG